MSEDATVCARHSFVGSMQRRLPPCDSKRMLDARLHGVTGTHRIAAAQAARNRAAELMRRQICAHIALTCERGLPRIKSDQSGADFAKPQVRRVVTYYPGLSRMAVRA